jgi:hypothetical protein
MAESMSVISNMFIGADLSAVGFDAEARHRAMDK